MSRTVSVWKDSWWKCGKAVGVYSREGRGSRRLALLAEQGTDAIWSRMSTQRKDEP